jgi:hypothetical protein
MRGDLEIRRFQHRDGFRLADAAEVALPAYTLNVEAVTMAHKRLSPIDEFVLRSISIGIGDASEISEYLGLSNEVLTPALATLAQTENVALAAQTGQQAWVVTKKGEQTLEAAEIVAPENRTFPIKFDAILRKPSLFRFQKMYRYKDLEIEGLIEVEVFPPRRPEQKEISATELERVIRPLAGGSEQRRDVLAIRSIDGASIRKVYLRATALLFKSLDDGGLQLGFIVDGRLSQEHELGFAASPGFQRFIDKAYAGKDLDADAEVSAMLSEASVDQDLSLAVAVSEAEANVVKAADEVSNAKAGELEHLKKRLEESELRLATLVNERKKQDIRNLYMLDHPPLLADAIKTAKTRVMIISPWIYGIVVDADFLQGLESLLRNGVRVLIGYGINEEETQLKRQIDIDARERLRALADRYSNCVLKRLGNTHAKILIKDDDFAVVTSFNWLSFRGDPNKKLRDEQGVLIQNPVMVNQKFTELEPRFA